MTTNVATAESRRLANRERVRRESAAIGDIGELPPRANPERYEAARHDFKYFCLNYFPGVFSLEFSPDHLRVIAKIEEVVLQGGLFAIAMPRGSGKTALCTAAATWAMLYAHRKFAVLIGSTADKAAKILASVCWDLRSKTSLLSQDFPEACYPFAKLGRAAQRRLSYHEKPIELKMHTNHVTFPDLEGSICAGARIEVCGLTGDIRGAMFKRPDGTLARPDLVLPDDPQTDESAKSLQQCDDRETIITGAVLGMAGPAKSIACLVPCTVIRPGDLADRLLDRERHPEFQGERTKMLNSLPTDEALWREYAEIMGESQRSGRGVGDATAFYAAHRAEMDAGAEASWPARFSAGEISAIQSGMNIKISRPRAFAAEYQNEPLSEESEAGQLSAEEVLAKLSNIPCGIVAIEHTRLTAFTDVHADIHYWMVCAWSDDFTGDIIDYGTCPPQVSEYFSQASPDVGLSRLFPGMGQEGQIFAGLKHVMETIGADWQRADKSTQKVERCLIDANYSKDVVKKFCGTSSHASIITPSHGKFFGASTVPVDVAKKKGGERVGLNWRMPKPEFGVVRHVVFDANYWKSFVRNRLRTAAGDRGCLSLYGNSANRHRLLADHLTAEYSVSVSGRGRKVDEWKVRVGRDNHWLDCLVGCAVAASILGCSLPEAGGRITRVVGPRKSLAQQQAEANARSVRR